MFSLRDVYVARQRVSKWARHTPLEYSSKLSELCGGEVWLKLENQQVTGSFKIRGATNKILGLSMEERRKGVVTASSGNHAQGVGYAARELGVKATVVVPENTPLVKIEAIRAYGVDLIVWGDEYMDSERLARRLEQEKGMTFVSAYNDPEVIKGQATVGLEMLEDNPLLDTIVVPVGGGGLMTGIATVFKAATDAEIIGVQTDASPVMYESLRKGEVHEIPLRDSYAEGLHGGLEMGTVTFEACRNLVDDWLILGEDTVLDTIGYMLHSHHMIVEGAGAVGPAAIRAYPERFKGRKVGVVISGGNLSATVLQMVA